MRTRRRDRGVMLIVAAGMIFVLLAFVGLAFDVGYLQWQRRRAQNAADGGAMDGAWAKVNAQDIVTKGRDGSAKNLFTHNVNGVTVDINNPPLYGSFAGDANYVEAIVKQDAPSFFMNVLGFNTLPVRARAVANTQSFDTACVYALNPTVRSAITASGTPNLTFGCGVISESDADPSTSLRGNSTITMTNGATIGSVGVTDVSNNVSVTNTASHLNSPGDPLATLTMPTANATANCYQGPSLGMYTGPCSGSHSAELPSGGNYSPGVYCGGIQVNGGDSATFAAGLYIIAGSPGLTFNTSGTIRGTGVTFYITDVTGQPCTGMNGANGKIGAVTINAQDNLDLKAPTENPYAGILIFEDRNINNVPASKIVGGSGSVFNGAIYLPSSDLSFAGTSGVDGYMLIIADTLKFTGNTAFTLNDFPDAFKSSFPAFKSFVTMAE